MSSRREALERTLEITERNYHRNVEKIQAKLEALDKFGEDEFTEGTVLTFDKTFDGMKYYPYAAIKARDGVTWYTTGSGRYPNKFDWDGLVDFMSSGVKAVWVSIQWERLI